MTVNLIQCLTERLADRGPFFLCAFRDEFMPEL